MSPGNLRTAASAIALLGLVWVAGFGQNLPSPIHFAFHAIDFRLDSCPTPRRHAPETMAGGMAIFDFDNDGHPDLFFANGADILTLKKTSPKYDNRLFRNDGKGGFEDVTAKSGLAGTGYDTGVAVGDFDNDGFEDLFVGGVHGNHLYRNNGDGTFRDVTEKAGIAKPDPQYGPLWSVGGAWLDVNHDGLLDLFVVNYLNWDPATEPECPVAPGKLDYCHPKYYKPTPNQLFLNNGDGTFRDVSAEYGIRAVPGKGMGVGIADFDQDGWMDIFVANDKVYNSFFHNLGGRKFQEIGFDANVALNTEGQLISGMGVDTRDLDNDGFPDIAVVALPFETFPIFRNLGHLRFADVTMASGMSRLSAPMGGYSPNIADFDNDGWKDLFVARGHVQSEGYPKGDVDQPNSVFRNLGGMKFQALTAEAGFGAQPPRRHRGSAVADLNGDGRLDVVVTALGEPAEIWINDSPNSNHWIAFQLQGTKSNRDGIGARISLTAGGKTQTNHVAFASGYASSSAGPVHFGLGAAKSVDSVEIRWPSGIVQSLKNVPADRVVKVEEPR